MQPLFGLQLPSQYNKSVKRVWLLLDLSGFYN